GLQLGKKDLVDRLKKNSGNKKLQIVELAKAIPPKQLLDFVHGEEDEKEEEHDHGEHDPHVWLGIPEAICMVEKIRDALIDKDEKHADGYKERAAAYIKQLKELHEEGRQALKDKKNRKLITMHDSLRYFARAFDLQIVDSIQPRPGVEADNKK